MALFGKNQKQSAEEKVSLDNIEFECLSFAHMPPITSSENPEAIQICPTCENPMFPSVLATAILTGDYEARELVTTELVNCTTILPFLFWAQHNLRNRPFVIQGETSADVKASSSIPISEASQEDIVEILKAIESYGSRELGDATDLETLLVLGRNFLQWNISEPLPNGLKQVSLEPLPHFAVLNSNNFVAIRELASQVSKQLGWATWERYIDLFAKPLVENFTESAKREVVEVSIDFEVASKTNNEIQVANQFSSPEIEILKVDVLPNLAFDRGPSNLIGPVRLEIETQLDAYKTSEVPQNFELSINTSIRFLILAEVGIGTSDDELRTMLTRNFNLAIYFDASIKNFSWVYLDDVSSPVTKSDLFESQIINFGSESIKLALTLLNPGEAAKRLEGTPWHM